VASKVMQTSGRNLHCGVHAAGHSIYLHWAKLSDYSKKEVIKRLNVAHDLGNKLTVDNFLTIMDPLCSKDIQWIMAAPLNTMIHEVLANRLETHKSEHAISFPGETFEPDETYLRRNFWGADQLSGVLNELKINHSIYEGREEKLYAGALSNEHSGAFIQLVNIHGNHWESKLTDPADIAKHKDDKYDRNSLFSSNNSYFSFFSACPSNQDISSAFKGLVNSGNFKSYLKNIVLINQCDRVLKQINRFNPNLTPSDLTKYDGLKQNFLTMTRELKDNPDKFNKKTYQDMQNFITKHRDEFKDDITLFEMLNNILKAITDLLTTVVNAVLPNTMKIGG
jgi:hypothetical protein